MTLPEIDVGDVCIVGGGVAGALTALELQQAGATGVLFERQAFAAEQSGHNHTYLHRGAIYPDGSQQFVDALRIARTMWDELLGQAGVAPIVEHSSIGFINPFSAEYAAERWRRRGIPFVLGAPPRGFERVSSWFRTDEPAFDLTPLYQHTLDRLGSVAPCVANVLRLRTDGHRRVIGLDVQVGTSRLRIRAQAFVIAAGAGSVPLVEGAFGHRGRLVLRPSFMLVVAGEGLGLESVVLPSPETGGLFIVPRVDPVGGLRWLVSDFVSLRGPLVGLPAKRAWERGVLRALRLVCDRVDDPGVQVGSYFALKAELRSDPRLMGLHAIETFGCDNLAVICPTKLSLAPLLAVETQRHIVRAVLANGRLGRASEVRDLEKPRVASERWMDTPLTAPWVLDEDTPPGRTAR